MDSDGEFGSQSLADEGLNSIGPAVPGQDQQGRYADLELVEGSPTRLRWIPPGSFLMGSPDYEPFRWSDEGPQHEVVLNKGFWLADTPCSQSEWQAIMGENPSQFRGESRPVESVSWRDCQEFCKRLREGIPGLAARLPSEAEWEYACRAGTESPYNDGTPVATEEELPDVLSRLGWFGRNSGGETHPVKERLPNRWGLYDMHGNVWEWCHDCWGRYVEGTQVDPLGPSEEGFMRVFRGGSWFFPARGCRSAVRVRGRAGLRSPYLGFRLAVG
jgi:formylglycine-generating enzyme required for sulfatase activity